MANESLLFFSVDGMGGHQVTSRPCTTLRLSSLFSEFLDHLYIVLRLEKKVRAKTPTEIRFNLHPSPFL